MSVEFRPRKLGEHARIALKRKWLILLPTIAIGLAIGYVVFRLPDIYESVTLIVVTTSTLPNTVVPTITEETLTRELTSISQVVTSRSSLQPLMEKYDLYKDERLRGEPMELLIDSMRKQIKVEVNTSNHEITNGFNITYRGRDPKSTQAVAAELAGKYIDEQTKGTVNAGTSAKQFIEEQVRRRSEYEGELQNLLTSLREKNPDVVAKRKQIEDIKAQQDQMINDWKDKIEERKKKLIQLSDPRILSLKTQIAMMDSDNERQQKMLDDTNKQIAELDGRINAIPNAEVGIEAIDREYQTKKLNYDNLLAQQQKVVMGADAAKDQQGGGIQVVDPANLPERPVAPKRAMLTAVGFGIGLALGLILAVGFEFRRLFTIQTTEDAKHYTNLPVLATIPELLTPTEALAIPRRRTLVMAAGFICTIAAIPALAFVLHFTHLFDKFLM